MSSNKRKKIRRGERKGERLRALIPLHATIPSLGRCEQGEEGKGRRKGGRRRGAGSSRPSCLNLTRILSGLREGKDRGRDKEKGQRREVSFILSITAPKKEKGRGE